MKKNSTVWIIVGVVVLVLVYLGWYYYGGMKTSYSSPATSQTNQNNSQASVGDVLRTINDAKFGTILIGPNGRTLYTNKNDTDTVSACYSTCAVNWPPLALAGTPKVSPGIYGAITSLKRTDGIAQLVYNGKPLYYWINDKKAGDVTGDGVGGIWAVAKP